MKSDIPTLIYGGGLDTQTAVVYGREVHRHLPRSMLLEWPANGHILISMSLDICAGTIAAAFLDAPDTSPDTACATTADYKIPFEKYYRIMADKLAGDK
ncbi:MAG: alpha/beta hydrolase [Rhodobacteraceae bacterium]|uniref:alpha/beta hydrolase n=1 Tax=Marivita sp. XM-24bin2 TaxID=2133951 RepID=UPI0025BCB727|nr:alpha/beta hydrolase [Marivita sp. XM-24bin2]MCR9107388.1 alpha/beta hydrolase [Paracoccaceae bacterium]